MTRLQNVVLGFVALLLICLACSWALQRRSVAKAEAAEQRALVLGVERDKALEQANQEAAGRKAAEADLAKARARVAAARPRPTIQTVPEVPHSAAVAGSDPTGDLVPALDDLVSKLDEKVASLERENGDLRLELGKSMKQTRALEIALDAQKRATSSSKWLGRFQGFAIGVSVGYVGGKL